MGSYAPTVTRRKKFYHRGDVFVRFFVAPLQTDLKKENNTYEVK
jgi:hypothetical protein